MKKFISFIVCVILFSACKQSKQGIVQDLLEAENSFEKEKVNQFLSDSFMFYGPETLNKEGYLSRVDSLKSIECQSTILKIQVLDSIVKTEEQERSIIDSLLEVTPAIIRKKTYRFIDDKLQSITVDSTLYLEEYLCNIRDGKTFGFHAASGLDSLLVGGVINFGVRVFALRPLFPVDVGKVALHLLAEGLDVAGGRLPEVNIGDLCVAVN